MVNFLRTFLYTLLDSVNSIIDFLNSSIGIAGLDITVLELIFGTGLTVALGWAIVKFFVGF